MSMRPPRFIAGYGQETISGYEPPATDTVVPFPLRADAEWRAPLSDTYDPISPRHYQFSNGVEVIDITEHLPFLEGNIVKYAARLGKKPGNDALQEAKKIQWYANRLVTFYERLGNE